MMPAKLPTIEQHATQSPQPARLLPAPPAQRTPRPARDFKRTLEGARSASKPKTPPPARHPAAARPEEESAPKAPKPKETDSKDNSASAVDQKEQPAAQRKSPDGDHPQDQKDSDQPPKAPVRTGAVARLKRQGSDASEEQAADQDSLELGNPATAAAAQRSAAELPAEDAAAQEVSKKTRASEEDKSTPKEDGLAASLGDALLGQQPANVPVQAQPIQETQQQPAALKGTSVGDAAPPGAEASNTSASSSIALPAGPQTPAPDDQAFAELLDLPQPSHERDEKDATTPQESAATGPDGVRELHPAPKADAPAAAAAPGFVEENHPRIISGIRSELLPNGGTMHIRLDPPELGALQVKIEMRDGHLTASFETSNDDATRLLSHSLTLLKQTLEAHGVSVEKLQVQQSPKQQAGGHSGDSSHEQQSFQDSSSRREQQRRETLQRLWRRLRDGSDPLDMTA